MSNLQSPFTGGPVEVVTETRSFEMRGQQLSLDVQLYKCLDTGELFTTGEQDEELVARLHGQYRERNHLPCPAQLVARRKALRLSAREASRLLGFGVNQFGQYEAGELPSESNMLLLQLFCDPSALSVLVGARRLWLAARTLAKLQPLVRPVAPKATPSLALVGGNWSGPGAYLAVGAASGADSEKGVRLFAKSYGHAVAKSWYLDRQAIA